MRITAGSLRGRRLRHTKRNHGVRPTTARVREALFNIIGNLERATVLDCFAGSGIIAIEAISRGARSVVSLEQQHDAVHSMQAVAQAWKLTDYWKIKQTDVARALSSMASSHFSLIFADPPYHSDWSQRLPQLLQQYAITADQLVIEEASDVTVAWPTQVSLLSSRRYGESTLHFLQLEESTQ